jgi:tetratricopeptide (TPR) repeat protein
MPTTETLQAAQLRAAKVKPGRNEPCGCGSGKKYKKCCEQAKPAPTSARPFDQDADAGTLRSSSLTRALSSGQISELVAQVRAGHHPEAETHARDLLAQDPNAGLIWKILALSLWMQGKDSLQALVQAAALLPADAEAHTNLGNAFRAVGQLDDAMTSHRRALAISPGYAEAHNNLGTALRDLRRLDEAAASYRTAVAVNANFAMAHTNLGQVLLDLGLPDDAMKSHCRALAISPNYAEAHNNLGMALRDLRRLDDAAASYRRAVAIKSDFASAHTNLGSVQLELGQLDDAVISYRRAAVLQPESAEAHNALGGALRALWQLDAAVASYRQALAIRPDYAEVYNNLGNALFFLGQHDDAAASCRTALSIRPDLAAVHSNLGMVLMLQNQTAQAEVCCRRALEIDPALTGAMVLLAELHANEGRFSEAEGLLKRAISIEPDMPEAWAGLVRWRKVASGDAAWLSEAQRIAGQRLVPQREVHLRYALGKYFDDVREFEQAFANYRRANELTKQHNAKYDGAEFSRYVDMIVQFYDREWLRQLSARHVGSERPVFVVGMWRSGTTLTEQILASHPAVFGAGELPYWKAAATTYERSVSDGDMHGETIDKLATEYLKLLGDLSADALRVVDKMSSNFLHLGLIHAALPDARIIHLQRNPIDTCLSIYFQDFHYAHLYANDLEDLAHYYSQYLRLMQHWKQTLPDHAMLNVPYEALVDDQEAWSRVILEFMGLPWDPRCLDFHRTSRTVTTSSKWQVRQAIHRSSVERWRNYEPFVAPLLRLATPMLG